MSLAKLLRASGIVDAAVLDRSERIAAQRRQPLGHVLVAAGAVDARRLGRFLADRLGLPLTDIGDGDIHPRVLALLPPGLARRARALPVALQRRAGGDFLVVAMSDPTDRDRSLELEAASRHPVLPLLVDDAELGRALRRFYGGEGGTDPGHAALPSLEPAGDEPPVVVGAAIEDAPASWLTGPRWLTESTAQYLDDLGLQRALDAITADTEDLSWLAERIAHAAGQAPSASSSSMVSPLAAGKSVPGAPVEAAPATVSTRLDALQDATIPDGGLSSRSACAATHSPQLAWLAGDLVAQLRGMHFVDDAKAAVALCRQKGDVDLVLLLDPQRDGPTLEALLELSDLQPRPRVAVFSTDPAFARIRSVDLLAPLPDTAAALHASLVDLVRREGGPDGGDGDGDGEDRGGAPR